jgi:riboflavin kinase/FMN adenylyltransferase
MKIYRGLQDFTKLKNAVVTSGTFDGVHIGHQKILQRLEEIAEQNGGETVLLTYWPHPRLVLYKEQQFKLLNSIEEKARLLEKSGVAHLLIIPFTTEFSQMSSERFIKNILVKRIGTKKLVIGYNHRFGKNREGSFEELRKNAPQYGFEVEEIPKQMIDHLSVSSTKIRKALDAGLVEIANEYLGKPYSLTGTVVEGDKIGRKLGFPTANIHIDFDQKLIPADGIYAVRLRHERAVYDGMLNIGYRPTFEGKKRRIEVHIFDFDKSIYGDKLMIRLFKQTRREIKFPNMELLKQQLATDKKTVQQVLKNMNI